MSETNEEKPVEVKLETAKEENKELARINALILKNRSHMTSDYRNTVKHTGGLLTQSMSIAYSRAILDVLTLINKPIKGNDNVQETPEEK